MLQNIQDAYFDIVTYLPPNPAAGANLSFTAPEGDWTLEITVDKEGLVWEIDETNNVWSTNVTGSSGGFGAVAMASRSGQVAYISTAMK